MASAVTSPSLSLSLPLRSTRLSPPLLCPSPGSATRSSSFPCPQVGSVSLSLSASVSECLFLSLGLFLTPTPRALQAFSLTSAPRCCFKSLRLWPPPPLSSPHLSLSSLPSPVFEPLFLSSPLPSPGGPFSVSNSVSPSCSCPSPLLPLGLCYRTLSLLSRHRLPPLPVCEFPVAAVTNGHMLGGLRKHKFVLRVPEARSSQAKGLVGLVPPGGSERIGSISACCSLAITRGFPPVFMCLFPLSQTSLSFLL